MTARRLVVAGLRYYWRTNLAVVVGVATAVAVLAGALLVGDSVRGSLRDLVLQRLGRVDRIVVSSGFFREALADEIRAGSGVPGVFRRHCSDRDRAGPRHGSSERQTGVARPDLRRRRSVLATSSRHGPDRDRTVAVCSSAARWPRRSGRRPTARSWSASSVRRRFRSNRFTRARTISARSLRLTVRAVLDASALGDFSLRPQQGDVFAAFVPLQQLQREIRTGRPRQRTARVRSARHSRPSAASERQPRVAPQGARSASGRRPDAGSARSAERPVAGESDGTHRSAQGRHRRGSGGRQWCDRASCPDVPGEFSPERRTQRAVFAGHGDGPSIDRAVGDGAASRFTANRDQRLDRSGSRCHGRRPADARLLRLGGSGRPGARGPPTSPWQPSCRSPAPPPIAISRLSIPGITSAENARRLGSAVPDRSAARASRR